MNWTETTTDEVGAKRSTATRGALIFTVIHRSRSTREARLEIRHRTVNEGRTPILQRPHRRTDIAMADADRFDYRNWREDEIARAKKGIAFRQEQLEKAAAHLDRAESLPESDEA